MIRSSVAAVAVLLVVGVPTHAAVSDAEVDRAMRMAGKPATREAAQAKIEQMGADAVPRLVEHVQGGRRVDPLLALMCLQYAWADEAAEPVAARLVDPDPQVRQFALHVLRRQVDDGDALAPLLQAAAAHRDPAIAGPARAELLRLDPDAAGIIAAARSPASWPQLAKVFPRVQDPAATPAAVRMLGAGDEAVVRAAVVSLIHQHADDEATRRRVATLLAHREPNVRDVACDYFRWHGTVDDLPRLRAAAERSRDRQFAAGVDAAVAAVERRAERFKAAGTAVAGEPGTEADARAAYTRALALLNEAPTQAVRRHAIAVLRAHDPMAAEVQYARGGRDGLDAGAAAAAAARVALMRAVAGYDNAGVSPVGSSRRQRQPDVALPAPGRVAPPVRDYFDPKRQSYGLRVGEGDGPFANSHHVGDDCLWRVEHGPVFAVAGGVVRHASVAAPSWGGLVIIEHVNPGDDTRRFCTLYGHLGPLVEVKVGDVVEAGQKIGALGRKHTFEGGGYVAHLHFGLHEGPYADGGWITGYLRGDRFDKPGHGWVDPQAFLLRRGAR